MVLQEEKSIMRDIMYIMLTAASALVPGAE